MLSPSNLISFNPTVVIPDSLQKATTITGRQNSLQQQQSTAAATITSAATLGILTNDLPSNPLANIEMFLEKKTLLFSKKL